MSFIEFILHCRLWRLIGCQIIFNFILFSGLRIAAADDTGVAMSINRPFPCWNQQLEDEFRVAKILYKEGRYDSSARMLTFIERKCSTPFVLLGIGVSVLHTGDCPMAIYYLHKFLDSSNDAIRRYSFPDEVKRAFEISRANAYERLSQCSPAQPRLSSPELLDKSVKQSNRASKLLAFGISSGLLGVSMLALGIGLNFAVIEKKAVIQSYTEQNPKEHTLAEHNQLRAASISNYSLGSMLSVTSLFSIGIFWGERRR